MEILVVTTHSEGGKDYLDNLFKYLGDDRMILGKPYGVCSKDPADIADMFWLVAKFFGNADKNLVIHYIISFSRDTAPDEWTAFRIVNEVLQPLIEEHMAFLVVHRETRGNSDYHVHIAVSTTNFKDGSLLRPDNKLNFLIAQRIADVTGEKCAFDPDYNYNEDEEEIQSQNNAKKRFYRKFPPQSEF